MRCLRLRGSIAATSAPIDRESSLVYSWAPKFDPDQWIGAANRRPDFMPICGVTALKLANCWRRELRRCVSARFANNNALIAQRASGLFLRADEWPSVRQSATKNHAQYRRRSPRRHQRLQPLRRDRHARHRAGALQRVVDGGAPDRCSRAGRCPFFVSRLYNLKYISPR